MYRIGRIVRTHGVKGEVKIASTSDFERLIPGKVIYYVKDNTEVKLEIESVRRQQELYLVKFKGLDSLTEVETFKGLDLFTNEEPDLLEDEFTFESLKGLEVITEEGVKIGKVIDVLSLPSQELLVIRGERKKEILIPFLKQFVIEVSDKITVRIIEGMI